MPPTSSRSPLGLIGHSHTVPIALSAAATRRPDFAVLRLRDTAYLPNIQPRSSSDAPLRAHPALLSALDSFCAANPVLVCAVFGNAHNVLSMVEHDRPFDFVARDEPQAQLAPGRERVPEAFVRSRLSVQLEHACCILEEVARRAQTPVLVLAPPPVVPDAHLLAHPGVFAQEFARRGAAPASVRKKVWRMSARMMRAMTRHLPLNHLPPPRVTVDSDGFLAEGFRANDPTHGNGRYGFEVLVQIDAWLARAAATQNAG